ncbi:unnamed protein product [Paramecium pentaurelia]|uniref:Uncharacterized protein n=1 Tax=Paramecium pentaurelia TaxID=43138 RepID=A0A8S1WMK4_9CILI|nr:unnamed protein product [Paramecium pentaurelia]
MYLLFEQNYIFEVPQRVVQKTKECNILYFNNKVVNQGRIIQFYIKQGDYQTLSIQNKLELHCLNIFQFIHMFLKNPGLTYLD